MKLNRTDLKGLKLATSRGNELISSRLFEACRKGNNFILGDTYQGVNLNIPGEVRTFINIPDLYGSNKNEYSVKQGYQRFFHIEQLEDTSEEYLKRKEQYESDLKAYNEHPGLYDHEPEFKLSARWIIYVTDLGKQFVEWYVKGTVYENGEEEI